MLIYLFILFFAPKQEFYTGVYWIFFFFNMEKGNVNQLPEIMAKYKVGSSNSMDMLIFWEHLNNSEC